MAGEHGGDNPGRVTDEGGARPRTGGGSNGGTVQQIINFFAGKGLGQNAIAAILGNMSVESGFNTSAYNGNEGAIGLAQWEGGRRTGLQHYAASHGMSETDLNAQLGYYWYELNHGYSGVLRQLKAGGSAGQLAAVVDGQYEVSSGSSRGQRVANAESYAASGLKGIKGNASGGGGGGSAGYVAAGGKAGGYAITGSGTLQPLKLSKADYEQALGDMAGLLNGVPQLKSLLNQAVAGGWSESKFEQAVEQSKWWRNHGDDARKMISLQYQDPAEYKQEMGQGLQHVKDLAGQMGVTLSSKALASVAKTYLYQGWDDNALNDRLADWFTAGQPLKGQAAQLGSQLDQIYGEYGVPMGTTTRDNRIGQILQGNTTIDTYQEAAKNAAKSMYPSLAAQLDAGQTVKDIADPYVQTMGNLLEIDPNNITLQDPLIKKALQGSVTTANGKSTATSTPLYQFETTLRNDPRWASTDNAHQTINSAIMTLGKDFGFEAA